MSEITITPEERQFMISVFKDIRTNLETYMTERSFLMSNAQLFAFLMFTPNALAIASDGQVDETEIAALEKISRNIDVRQIVNLNLLEMMAYAFEPEGCMTNEEFNLRAGAELLFLSRNMAKFETHYLAAVKTWLKFDSNPKRDGSMTGTFVKMMDTIVEKNLSKNKDEERKKLDEIKAKLEIA